MAAIADPSHSSDLEKLVKDMEKALPPYARPVFLRFLPEVNKTGKMLCSLLVVFFCCDFLLAELTSDLQFTHKYETANSRCASRPQERLSFRRQSCVGTASTPAPCQTDCTSWIPAEGATHCWTRSFTAP